MTIKFNDARGIWEATSSADVNAHVFNNFLEYGQPFSPYEDGFRTDLNNHGYPYDGRPTIALNSDDVIKNGFGNNVSMSDFDIVKNLRSTNLANGSYSLTQLQKMGVSKPGPFGDHAQGFSTYSQLDKIGAGGKISSLDLAYIFGSVRFELSQDTKFTIKNGKLVEVSGRIDLQDDSFKHQSGALSAIVSALVWSLAGQNVNFDLAKIVYDGEGAYKVDFPNEDRCFPADTQIQTAITASAAISALVVGDIVLAFDASANLGRGALVPRRVTRLYRNTTTEWIKLVWVEAGEQKEVITTPGHHFLDQFGHFPTIAEMTRNGTTTVVLASGELAEVTAERIIYSAATAHLFERAQVQGMVMGNAALKPVEMDAWQTYNFEVEDLHTYVAGGVRVHNDSGFLGVLGDALFSAGLDGSGARDRFEHEGFLDTVGDVLSNVFHAAGEIVDGVLEGIGNAVGAVVGAVNQVFEAIFGPGGNSNSPDHTTRTSWTDTDGRPHWGSVNEYERAEDAGTVASEGTSTSTNDDESDSGSQSSKPVLLDLNGNGIEITDFDRSTIFMDGGDGLLHRTAWAGAGDGVLFFDEGNDGKITEKREYVITEWNPTASGDLEAIRSVWDSNGDGKLTAADTDFAKFKVMVTNANGTTTVQTLA